MKKIIAIFSLFLALSASAQHKDSAVQITLKLSEYRALLYTIDKNVDSKQVTAALLELLQKNTVLVDDKIKK